MSKDAADGTWNFVISVLVSVISVPDETKPNTNVRKRYTWNSKIVKSAWCKAKTMPASVLASFPDKKDNLILSQQAAV